jgi:leucyl-tRNA synthetase
MFFFDQGWLDFEEPYKKFRAHGLIIKNGAKMSKSKGNIVNPDEYVAKHGADTLRCYLMFLGPLSTGGDFRDAGMKGMYKFLTKVYRLCQEKLNTRDAFDGGARLKAEMTSSSRNNLEKFWIHKTIKRITEGIERFKYNTCLAGIMEYINFLKEQATVSRQAVKTLIILLAPFAPHLAEELWQQYKSYKSPEYTYKITGRKTHANPRDLHKSVHHEPWPEHNPELMREDTVEIVIQVNGKVRERISLPADLADKQDQVEQRARKSPKIKKYLTKEVRKTVFLPGKIINFVV